MHMPFMPCIYARTCKRIYMQYRCTSCVALCTIPRTQFAGLHSNLSPLHTHARLRLETAPRSPRLARAAGAVRNAA